MFTWPLRNSGSTVQRFHSCKDSSPVHIYQVQTGTRSLSFCVEPKRSWIVSCNFQILIKFPRTITSSVMRTREDSTAGRDFVLPSDNLTNAGDVKEAFPLVKVPEACRCNSGSLWWSKKETDKLKLKQWMTAYPLSSVSLPLLRIISSDKQ